MINIKSINKPFIVIALLLTISFGAFTATGAPDKNKSKTPKYGKNYPALPKGCEYAKPVKNKVTVICDGGSKKQVLHATIRCKGVDDGLVSTHIGPNIRASKGKSIAKCSPGEFGPYSGPADDPVNMFAKGSIRGWFSL